MSEIEEVKETSEDSPMETEDKEEYMSLDETMEELEGLEGKVIEDGRSGKKWTERALVAEGKVKVMEVLLKEKEREG